MPRIARVVAAEHPHYITQRGNYQQKIFADDTHRRKYLSLLKEESKRYHLTILAYCLMSNHVHFMVIPQREDSMGLSNHIYGHTQVQKYIVKSIKMIHWG